jgi:hypothetical protein
MSEQEKGMSRRGLTIAIAVAAVVLAGAGIARLVLGKPNAPREGGGGDLEPASSAVRTYFGPALTDGSKLDRWTIVSVFDVHNGAIPVLLATADGTRIHVDLLRRDPAGPRGMAETQQLALFVSNHGDGGTSTPEEQAQGVQALAAALTARESGGAVPPPLSTLKERSAAFPIKHAPPAGH